MTSFARRLADLQRHAQARDAVLGKRAAKVARRVTRQDKRIDELERTVSGIVKTTVVLEDRVNALSVHKQEQRQSRRRANQLIRPWKGGVTLRPEDTSRGLGSEQPMSEAVLLLNSSRQARDAIRKK